MTPQEVKAKLELARKQQKNLRKEIEKWRLILKNEGQNPDAPKFDLIPRNKMIYTRWKKGKSFVQIARDYNLSSTRISSICKRIDFVLKKTVIPDIYKDLLRYRTDE